MGSFACASRDMLSRVVVAAQVVILIVLLLTLNNMYQYMYNTWPRAGNINATFAPATYEQADTRPKANSTNLTFAPTKYGQAGDDALNADATRRPHQRTSKGKIDSAKSGTQPKVTSTPTTSPTATLSPSQTPTLSALRATQSPIPPCKWPSPIFKRPFGFGPRVAAALHASHKMVLKHHDCILAYVQSGTSLGLYRNGGMLGSGDDVDARLVRNRDCSGDKVKTINSLLRSQSGIQFNEYLKWGDPVANYSGYGKYRLQEPAADTKLFNIIKPNLCIQTIGDVSFIAHKAEQMREHFVREYGPAWFVPLPIHGVFVDFNKRLNHGQGRELTKILKELKRKNGNVPFSPTLVDDLMVQKGVDKPSYDAQISQESRCQAAEFFNWWLLHGETYVFPKSFKHTAGNSEVLQFRDRCRTGAVVAAALKGQVHSIEGGTKPKPSSAPTMSPTSRPTMSKTGTQPKVTSTPTTSPTVTLSPSQTPTLSALRATQSPIPPCKWPSPIFKRPFGFGPRVAAALHASHKMVLKHHDCILAYVQSGTSLGLYRNGGMLGSGDDVDARLVRNRDCSGDKVKTINSLLRSQSGIQFNEYLKWGDPVANYSGYGKYRLQEPAADTKLFNIIKPNLCIQTIGDVSFIAHKAEQMREHFVREYGPAWFVPLPIHGVFVDFNKRLNHGQGRELTKILKELKRKNGNVPFSPTLVDDLMVQKGVDKPSYDAQISQESRCQAAEFFNWWLLHGETYVFPKSFKHTAGNSEVLQFRDRCRTGAVVAAALKGQVHSIEGGTKPKPSSAPTMSPTSIPITSPASTPYTWGKEELMRRAQLGPLSESQLHNYDRDGFLLLRASEWLTPSELHNLLSWTEEVQHWPDKAFHWMKYYETSSRDGSKILNRVENYMPYHAGLNQIFNGSKALDMLRQLLGGECVLYKDKINMKLPGAGGFEPHQDVLAGWGAYNVSNFVTFSVSLDHAHLKNGALECVAGEHKRGKLADDWSPLDDKLVDSMDWALVETFPGDVIMFDAYVPHRSAPNGADHSRRNLYLTYNLVSEGDHRLQYYIDKRKNYPPDIEREPGKVYEYKI